MAADSRFAIQVEGLKELIVMLKAFSPELQTELHAAMKGIVEEVAMVARAEAVRQGFAPPGRSGRGVGNLIGSIRTGVTQTSGYIEDTANRDGYSYPRRYEYEHGMERAFFHPAIDKERARIIAEIEVVLERAMAKFNVIGSEGGS